MTALHGRPGERYSVSIPGPLGAIKIHVWPGAPVDRLSPVLVCLHGWLDSGEVFGPLARALQRWTVVAPDAPGHGGSGWRLRPTYRVADIVRSVERLMDELDSVAGPHDGAVVHGHSMGALAAARVAARRPDVVRHLLLEEPIHSLREPVPTAVYQMLQDRTAALWVRRLRKLDHRSVWSEFVDEMSTGAPEEFDPWIESKRAVKLSSVVAPMRRGPDLEALLADVTCPVSLIRGLPERGGKVCDESARRCADACDSGCTIHTLAAGHTPRRQAPTEFNRLVADILDHYRRQSWAERPAQ